MTFSISPRGESDRSSLPRKPCCNFPQRFNPSVSGASAYPQTTRQLGSSELWPLDRPAPRSYASSCLRSRPPE